MTIEHVDVLIIGAGLSGIGAAHHLQANCPGKSYAILEGRDSIGGTWDLFRYPGIRSDSDMYTLGYSFRPWEKAKAIAAWNSRTPEALAASPEVAKLVAEAEARGMERAAEIYRKNAEKLEAGVDLAIRTEAAAFRKGKTP